MSRCLVVSLFVLLITTACKPPLKTPASSSGWTDLLNGKDLSGWDTYLGPLFDSAGKQVGAPIGLNTDPNKTFSVVMVDNQPTLRISGEHFGGISTQQEFANFHLRLEFKWGTLKWAPRKNAKRDSGLLYHAVAPHGAGHNFWMRSQEFQVQEGDCGDYWSIAKSTIDIPATEVTAGEFRYDPTARLTTFGDDRPGGLRCFKNPDAEKPSGEWNILEVYSFGGTSVHIVNGKTVMRLFNSRYQSEDGSEVPLTKGKIQLQSEGAEVFYRDVQIRSISRVPEELGGER